VPKVLTEFKDFISRGNVIDLAVAVVLGAAFTQIVNAVVEGLLTPLIGILFSRDFSDMTFTINDSVFRYGHFINATITFASVAAAVYFFVVVPYQAYQRRRGVAPETRACPECTIDIPAGAKRCPNCTATIAAGA
jgi:large conductance mechanosensitive channel